MNRFLVEKIDAADKFIILNDPAQLHHLRDVLRARPKERIAVFDRASNEYVAAVVEIGSSRAKLEIKEKRPPNDLDIQITVACAIPKKPKMDDIIDKLTQLGVACIIPLLTERVIIKLDKQKKLQRFQRWEKIALSAVKQSQRSNIVVIKPVTDFKDLMANARDFDLKLIPTLEAERKTLKNIFSQTAKQFKKIMVLIGPEGDFTPQEVSLAKAAGFLPVTLGQQVLRVDTAAIAVVSFIKFNAGH
ncbi:MAG: RsmE family RNA methyltransferase [Candidatus Omnitrophica bacterium]|nr:RsmE family RNA methyltransferase [Candidatus Omnitrophota bacterium]